MKHRIHAQKGNASILFALMIPALFGVFTLATDGARALQTSARLNDASEMAVLAIAGLDDKNVSVNGGGSTVNKALATRYIQAYLPDAHADMNIEVKRRTCEQIVECNSSNNRKEFNEYEVQVTTKHDSWFPGNDAIAGFGDTFSVASRSEAKKLIPKAVDIVFIADYSGSMQRTIDGKNPRKSNGSLKPIPGNPRRFEELARIINEVTIELEKYNKNNAAEPSRVALTAYTGYTNAAEPGHWYYGKSEYCAIPQLRFMSGGDEDDDDKSLDVALTIATMLKEKKAGANKKNCLRTPYKTKRSMLYKNLPFTSDFSQFNKAISAFYPVGITAAIEGIIRGSQYSYHSGKNPIQLMIVLSDGDDTSSYATYFKQLNQQKICKQLKDKIKAKVKINNTHLQEIEVKMAAIGFGKGYSITDNRPLIDCVGRKNIYQANSMDEVKRQILTIISQEIGTIK